MAGVILCRAYFYQYQLGHISCIGWLEGRVASVTFCTSTLGITHTRKDTKLGYVCREADNELVSTLQYILQSSRVYFDPTIMKSPLKVQECYCFMVTHLLRLRCLWMVHGEHHKACRRGRRQYGITTACEHLHFPATSGIAKYVWVCQGTKPD